MITLCAATEFEISRTMEHIRKHALPVEVLITGVGMLPATYAITHHLVTKKPSLIVQAGVAGTLDELVLPETAVVVSSDCIGDAGVDVNGHFLSLFEMGLAEENEKPWTHGAMVNPHAQLLAMTRLPLVKSVTVNEVTTAKKTIDHYRKGLMAQVETMEGAALHYAALMQGTPFLQIRTISNHIGERDKKKWKMEGALDALNKVLERLLHQLPKP